MEAVNLYKKRKGQVRLFLDMLDCLCHFKAGNEVLVDPVKRNQENDFFDAERAGPIYKWRLWGSINNFQTVMFTMD